MTEIHCSAVDLIFVSCLTWCPQPLSMKSIQFSKRKRSNIHMKKALFRSRKTTNLPRIFCHKRDDREKVKGDSGEVDPYKSAILIING